MGPGSFNEIVYREYLKSHFAEGGKVKVCKPNDAYLNKVLYVNDFIGGPLKIRTPDQ
jgi:hypothetical protein